MNNRINPPKWPRRIFEWYCSADLAEDLSGDMDELFFENLRKMSPMRARWKYWMQTLVLLFSYAVRNRKRKLNGKMGNTSYHSLAMYQSYAKIALRNISRQKTFAVINVICLSIGMSVGLLALAAFADVTEVDQSQTNAQNIFRITTTVDDGSQKVSYANSSSPLAEQVRQEATGVEQVVQIYGDLNAEVVQSSATTIPLTGYFASGNFFTVFTFPLLEGNMAHALQKPFSIVITEEAATKLFNTTDVLGKVLEVKGLGNFEITGVVKKYPRSHLYFEVIASYSTLLALEQQKKIEPSLRHWGPLTSHYTYLLTNKEHSLPALQNILDHISASAFKDDKSIKVTYALQALTSIPMSDMSREIGQSWGWLPLVIFFSLALLVLLPACFNYTNIAIARAMKRAKEIGLRKVSGGESRHIFWQMVMETIIISIIALSGALLIFFVVRPEFLNMVVHGERTFDLEITPLTFTLFLAFAIVTGFLAGFFPAAYFSKLNPIETLRNATQSGKISKISIRKGLIVSQFALSMIFILGVAIIVKQYRYALNYDMGFEKENILDIPLKGVSQQALRTEFGKIGEVSRISMSSSIPGNWSASEAWVKTGPGGDSLSVSQMFIDENYIQNLGLKLVAGADFPEVSASREEYIIVNETFLKQFGLESPHAALDRSFLVDRNTELRIIGVVKDFNYMPLQEQISSFFFRYDPAQFNYANIKLSSSDIKKTLEQLDDTWKTITDQKFEPRFLDDELEASVTSFTTMIKLFGFLGLLAITISCLGLLAVVISAAESRVREMGIRKVFGASVGNLAYSLSKGFLKLIAIAIVIATPLTYFMFDQLFLRMHYYRASIGFTEIGVSILLLLLLVLLIIASQTLKVARINPVDTLKYE